MSRQIWTFFLVQKRIQLLGCKNQGSPQSWQQRFPTGTNYYKGRDRHQPTLDTSKSANCRSRKNEKRGTLVSSPRSNNVQEYGWTTQACSKDSWPCGPSKQKDSCYSPALLIGLARNFICSRLIVFKEEGGRKLPTICLCERLVDLFSSTRCIELSLW